MSSWRTIFAWEVDLDDPSWESLSEQTKEILRSTEYSGSLYLSGTPITSLGNLESVGRDLYLDNTPITSLGNLESVGGSLNLSGTPITSLGNLESVGGYLYLYRTPITSLGNLESVGRDLYLYGTPIARMNEQERNRVLSRVRVEGRILFE